MILVSKSPHDGSRKNYETVYRYAEKPWPLFFRTRCISHRLHCRVVVT